MNSLIIAYIDCDCLIAAVTDHVILNNCNVYNQKSFFPSAFFVTLIAIQLNYIKLNGLRPAFAEGSSVALGLPTIYK